MIIFKEKWRFGRDLGTYICHRYTHLIQYLLLIKKKYCNFTMLKPFKNLGEVKVVCIGRYYTDIKPVEHIIAVLVYDKSVFILESQRLPMLRYVPTLLAHVCNE